MRATRLFLTLSLSSQAFAAIITLPLQQVDHVASLSRRSRLSTRTTAAVPVGGAQFSYYAKLQVGTPAVDFLVLLDTGSSDLVLETAVQADSCTGCETTAPLYSASASSTSNVTTTPVKLVYGIGYNTGVVASDVVSFGATDVNSEFSIVGSSTGLLGLGWAGIAQTQATPLVQALWEKGLLDSPMFALAFGQSSSSNRVAAAGYLTLGGVNDTLHTGELAWFDFLTSTSSSSGGHWPVPVSDVSVNGASLSLSTDAAIVDSGTNSIVVPTSVAQKIYSAIPGSSYSTSLERYIYPCKTTVTLSFNLNGTSYAIDPTNFNSGKVDNTNCAGAVTDSGSGSGSGSDDDDKQPWILGTTFLMSYYTVFRFEPPAVGVAPIADAGKVLEKAPLGSSMGGTTSTASGGVGGRRRAGLGLLGWVVVACCFHVL
ncbi:acid protease [Meredithblackwellia eburnea MCA 4105]